MFLHQLDPRLYEGDSLNAQFNRQLYTAELTDVATTFVAMPSGAIATVRYTKTPIELGIMHGRKFVVADIIIKDKDVRVRQPFYCSTGTATPDKSPRGTWQPFAWLCTEAYAPVCNMFEDWIGKYYVSPDGKWHSHHKDRSTIPASLLEIMDAVTKNL